MLARCLLSSWTSCLYGIRFVLAVPQSVKYKDKNSRNNNKRRGGFSRVSQGPRLSSNKDENENDVLFSNDTGCLPVKALKRCAVICSMRSEMA